MLRILRDLGGDMARAGAGKLVGVNEESSVGITGVQREHPVVDKLLGALGLVAGGQQATRAVREETGLQPRGLGVVVVTIAVTLGDVLQDDSPVTLDVDGSGDLQHVWIKTGKKWQKANKIILKGRKINGKKT